MSQTRAAFKAACTARLAEAIALYDAERYDACVYFAGFALEMGLKARIMRNLAIESYPTDRFFKTHALGRLLMLAGLERKVADEPPLWASWSLVTEKWDPTSRYEPPGRVSDALALEVLDALSDKRGGLLPWLKRRW